MIYKPCFTGVANNGNAHERVFTSLLRGARRLGAGRELFDLALGVFEALAAEPVELFAALPQLQRLVQPGVAALEPVHDRFQLALGVLEAWLAHRVSSTRAPKPPSASSTSTRSPGSTALPERTISPLLRTMAWPRARVAFGESARRRPADCSSRWRLRSTSRRGARPSRSWVRSSFWR